MTVRTRAGVVALVLLTGLAACGSGSDEHLSAAAQNRLEQLTRQVRVAAGARDRARTRQSLDAVQREVVRGEHSGDIGASRAERLLADIAAARAKLALVPAVPTTTIEVPTTEPNVRPGKGDGKGNGEGKGNKHGHGKDGDEE